MHVSCIGACVRLRPSPPCTPSRRAAESCMPPSCVLPGSAHPDATPSPASCSLRQMVHAVFKDCVEPQAAAWAFIEHKLLEVYSEFPLWHARNGQKRNSKIPYSESKIERICQACQIGQDTSQYFAYGIFKIVFAEIGNLHTQIPLASFGPQICVFRCKV